MKSLRILRLKEVQAFVGLGRSSIYAAIQRGEFPRPIRIGQRAVGWHQVVIEDWLKTREKTEGDWK